MKIPFSLWRHQEEGRPFAKRTRLAIIPGVPQLKYIEGAELNTLSKIESFTFKVHRGKKWELNKQYTMQTILGSGGAIGTELAKALKKYTNSIRLVSRNPQKVNPTDEIFAADVFQPEALERALQGSEIVYVTIGFPYNLTFWRSHWPKFITHLLSLCEKENYKLVFFDNVYMYDKDALNPMTENTAIRPASEKGKIRAAIAQQILEKAQSGKVQALIARSADFYGPSIENTSVMTEMVLKPLSQGKTANWLMDDQRPHSFTYTPDAARGTALLGNTEKAYGQVWHLPTAPDPLTGAVWIKTIAQRMGVAPKYRVVPKWMVRLIGWFMPVMKESVEMLYQYDRDYVFDSRKIEKEFGISATPYLQGIEEILTTDYPVLSDTRKPAAGS